MSLFASCIICLFVASIIPELPCTNSLILVMQYKAESSLVISQIHMFSVNVKNVPLSVMYIIPAF